MTKAELIQHALALPIEEQIDLAQALWDHASPPVGSALTKELQDLLEARLLEAYRHPEAGTSWKEVKARLLKQ